MAKVQLPPGYCVECNKKTLDRVDLLTEAEDQLKELKRKMFIAFMLGDRDGALAEISYQLGITPGELAVSGPWESPAMDRKMAVAIAEEIYMKFPDVLEYLFERTGMYEKMRQKEENHRRHMERMDEIYRQDRNRFRQYPASGSTVGELSDYDRITPAKKQYYVPEYRVKKNER